MCRIIGGCLGGGRKGVRAVRFAGYYWSSCYGIVGRSHRWVLALGGVYFWDLEVVGALDGPLDAGYHLMLC